MNALAHSLVQQFDIRHGADGIRCGAQVVYSDGAHRDIHPLGLLADPSPNDHERLTWVLQHHEAHLQRAVEAFDERKQQLVHQANAATRDSYGSPDEGDLEELKQLQAVVNKHKKAVQKTRAKLEQTPEHKRRAAIQEMDARGRERASSMLSRIRQIDV